MTAKEHVLEIYPKAEVMYDALDSKYFVIVKEMSKKQAYSPVFLSRMTTNPNRAWRKAWKDIQIDMLEQFQSIT